LLRLALPVTADLPNNLASTAPFLQDTIFRVAGEPIVDNCLRGYNGCICACQQAATRLVLPQQPLRLRLLAGPSVPPLPQLCLISLLLCCLAIAVAYGQTGSGKTYTMLGRDEAAGTGASSSGGAANRDENRGLIQRVFEHLFARITKGGGKYLLECSFLELYNESITDLLDPSRTNLHVRENLEGPYVSNLTAHEVYRGD
jgi:kinesin family protein 15